MPENTTQDVKIYVMSVGQADTSIIITPEGKLIIIDAVKPRKLVDFLKKLGYPPGSEIHGLLITHPHQDHFSAANKLIADYKVFSAVFSPFWCSKGMGSPTYQKLVAGIEEKNIHTQFLSGFSLYCPDGSMTYSSSGDPTWDEQGLYLELLGPSNNLIRTLEQGEILDTNHLSVMARLNWGEFSMVFAGDAQMENWACFDQEGMLDKGCQILKSSHHGSGKGTQWERIYRLSPKCIVVSSDPDARNHLPDVMGAASFAKMDVQNRKEESFMRNVVALTRSTGTIEITAKQDGSFELYRYQDGPGAGDLIDTDQRIELKWDTNPTDWKALLEKATSYLYRDTAEG